MKKEKMVKISERELREMRLALLMAKQLLETLQPTTDRYAEGLDCPRCGCEVIAKANDWAKGC